MFTESSPTHSLHRDDRGLPSWRVELLRQLGPVTRVLLMVHLPTLLVLVLVGVQRAVPATNILRDAAHVMGAPFYVGVLSNTGLLLWAGSVAICLLALVVHKRDGSDREWQIFFLVSAVFGAILMIDDMMMLHERVFPDYLGISDKLIYGSYALMGVAYLVGLRSTIFKTEYLLLLVSLGFFALSILIDSAESMVLTRFGDVHVNTQTLLEDGAKLLGIAGWFAYFLRAGMGRLAAIKRGDPGDSIGR